MNFQEYLNYFRSILDKTEALQEDPYTNPDYLDYTKMNWSRMNRWLKTGVLSAEIKETVAKITRPQHWLIITEPWCGDAAHVIPFLEMISRQNYLITVEYELRDSAPFSIEQYLTNGSKSIPKLVIRNEAGEDLAIWGPRPEDCQIVYAELMKEQAPFEKVKVEIQNWYNADKGVKIQREIGKVLLNTL